MYKLNLNDTVSYMRAIRQVGDVILRKTAESVPKIVFGTKKLSDIINEMELILDTQPDGVALAAPQIGILYRIFIVRYDRLIETVVDGKAPPAPSIGIYINPKIIRISHKEEDMEEGCLSVRGIYGKVHRHNRTKIHAYTIDGKEFERGGGGLLAQIFQHETDHLNGILFIDRTDNLYRINHDEK